MDVLVRPRFGFGFDIEHNEDICYRAGESSEEDKVTVLLCYVGLLIKIPFFTIYLGDFSKRDKLNDD
jgi:hypothetical protein